MEISAFHDIATAMRRFAIILALCMVAPTAMAQSADTQYPDVETATPLSEAELLETFSGQTHRGSYNFLNRHITTFAFEEATKADGTLEHRQADVIDTGSWTVTGQRICYDYDDPGLRQACFQIYRRGNCFYHFQVSTMGQTRYGFTARSVIAGETPSCEPSLV